MHFSKKNPSFYFNHPEGKKTEVQKKCMTDNMQSPIHPSLTLSTSCYLGSDESLPEVPERGGHVAVCIAVLVPCMSERTGRGKDRRTQLVICSESGKPRAGLYSQTVSMSLG
jgi:hypothetical protein